jgi:hypothetical protein
MLRTVGVVGIFAIACGHDGGGISATDYAGQEAAAFCDYEVRCGLFANQTSCISYGAIYVDPSFSMLVDSGKVTFDGNAAQACLDALSTVPCDQTQMAARVTPSACNDIVTGTVAMSGTCEQNAECQSDACVLPDCGSACCTGSCGAAQAPAGSGEPCVTRACDVGLACSETSQTCVPLGGSGAGCMLTEDCSYGLGCVGGECATLPAIGDPCPDGECADLGAVCNAQATCVMVGLPGAPCATAEDCSPFAACNGTTCVALPTVGQPCATACSDGSYCTGNDGSGSGTCIAPAGNGAACTRGPQCASHYCGSGGCEAAPVCI